MKLRWKKVSIGNICRNIRKYVAIFTDKETIKTDLSRNYDEKWKRVYLAQGNKIKTITAQIHHQKHNS